VPEDIAGEIRRVEPRLGGFARPLHWLERTGSTNEVAARLADLGAAEGTTVVAESQDGGRGRLGRSWFSPPGAGLYVSLVLRPYSGLPAAAAGMSLLTLASGVAIAEGIRESTGLSAELKWPNDLMVRRRKLGGILAEAAHGHAERHVILGFGINLRAVAYPMDIADRATSLEAETGRRVDRAQAFAEIMAALAGRYGDLRAGKFDAILTAWRGLAPSLRASPVEWDSPNGTVRGRAEDVDDGGALLIRVGDRVERVIAGEVRWL
jgi:BirA family biotin operon repressor/biotin-[acetyl-CoA-carboxylase] ligase